MEYPERTTNMLKRTLRSVKGRVDQSKIDELITPTLTLRSKITFGKYEGEYVGWLIRLHPLYVGKLLKHKHIRLSPAAYDLWKERESEVRNAIHTRRLLNSINDGDGIHDTY